MYFFGVFLGVWKREKCREELGREQILEKCVSSKSDGCLGLFIDPSAFFKAAAIQGPLASKLL